MFAHRLTEGPRLDVLGRERRDELVAAGAELLLLDEEAGEPVGVQPIRGLRHEGETGQVGEGVAVAEGHRAPLLHALVEDLELPAADAREDVGQPVVVADLGVLVGHARIARLLGPEAGLVDRPPHG